MVGNERLLAQAKSKEDKYTYSKSSSPLCFLVNICEIVHRKMNNDPTLKWLVVM